VKASSSQELPASHNSENSRIEALDPGSLCPNKSLGESSESTTSLVYGNSDEYCTEIGTAYIDLDAFESFDDDPRTKVLSVTELEYFFRDAFPIPAGSYALVFIPVKSSPLYRPYFRSHGRFCRLP
jgi:hypothetical protein